MKALIGLFAFYCAACSAPSSHDEAAVADRPGYFEPYLNCGEGYQRDCATGASGIQTCTCTPDRAYLGDREGLTR